MKYIEGLRQPGKSVEDVRNLYANWAENYDKDVGALNYDGPAIAAKILAGLYPSDERAAVKILDLGAGTGLGGMHMKKHGFSNIDATDLSQEMLDIAAEKNVYTDLIPANFGTEPTDIADDTYDCLVGVGCFIPGHLDHACFPEIRRVVKPGKEKISLIQ